MKNAKSGRKKRSVTCKKSHAQICPAWLREIGRPLLASWLVGANSSHILLDSAFADAKAEFQQFPTNPFSAPEPIVFRHFSDQGDRFSGDLGPMRRDLGLPLPIQTEELPMPPEQDLWLDNEERLFPGPNEPCQQDEEHAIGPGDGWPFYLPLENGQLVSQEGIFCHELRFASAKVSEGASGKEVTSGFVQ
jgi:hypothetical protein